MDNNDSFTQRVYQILATIPEGNVASYGDIAFLADSPRAARQVGLILKRLPQGTRLPWHRVVSHKGILSLTGPSFVRQHEALVAEGIEISGEGEIDMTRYRWSILNSK